MAKEYIVIFHHDCEGRVNHWSIIDEIVRCKNCKYSSYEPHEEYENVYICERTVWTRMNGGNTADDYCSYGERIE